MADGGEVEADARRVPSELEFLELSEAEVLQLMQEHGVGELYVERGAPPHYAGELHGLEARRKGAFLKRRNNLRRKIVAAANRARPPPHHGTACGHLGGIY